MRRPQDILFGILALVIVALMAFDVSVTVLALVGAFACGSIYVFLGMIPSRDDGFWHRLFVTVFLSLVFSSLVLILPGTFGAHRPEVQVTVIIAALIPLSAVGFEIIRTPRITRRILRCLGYR